MLEDEENIPIATIEKKSWVCFEHWLQIANTAQQSGGAGKALVAMDTDRVEDAGLGKKSKDRVA